MVRSICLLVLISVASPALAQWLTKADEHPLVRPLVRAEHESGGPAAAAEWYMRQRKFGLGYVPQNAVQHARSQAVAMRTNAKSSSALALSPTLRNAALSAAAAQWTLIGPSNIGGRIECLAVDPTNPGIAYAGAADGGVWKTIDTGASWMPLTDNMETLSMGSIAIDPQNPNIIYAGTGELPNGDTYTGYGLYRSTDGGKTWTNIGPTNIAAYASVIVNPKHSNIIYAAAGRAGGGVLRSVDNGASWQWLGGGLPQGQVTELGLSMNGENAVLYAGVATKGVYRSDNGGDTWIDQTPNGWSEMRRICVTVDPKNWMNVAALSVSNTLAGGTDDLESIMRSDDGGDRWTSIDQTFKNGSQNLFVYFGNAPQGYYDVYLKADPNDFDHMLLGGLSIWERRLGSNDWSDVAGSYRGGIHPDQHAAAFAPSDPNIVYFGQDGGLFTSQDGGSTIDQQSSLPIAITQFYGIGIDQTDPDVTYGGTQDNGTMVGNPGQDWAQTAGGDGSYTLVDPTDNTIVYFAYTENTPTVMDNLIPGQPASISDSVSWLNPFTADASIGTVYWGAQHLWSSTDKGQSWVQLNTFTFGSGRAYISALDAFGDGGSLAIGTGTGEVYYTSDEAFNITNVSAGLPGRSVTCVKFAPSKATTFYVTLSGFGAGHVFKTTDAGSHWTNISSTLPDIPVNSIVIDPTNSNVLYVGTDVGVFFSPNGGAVWMPYGTGLPNVAVDYMDLHKTARVLRAGTHGRSIWEVPLVSNLPGISLPAQRTVWTVGDTALIQWSGFGQNVSVSISTDGGDSWHTLAQHVNGSSLRIDTVRYAPTANVLVKVSDDAQTTLLSPRFEIVQRKAGAEAQVVGEYPYYFYDLTYDADDNVLWATHFYSNSLYKIDPDNGKILDSVHIDLPSSTNITGVAYDPASKHLFVHQLKTTGTESWTSNVVEVTLSGNILRNKRSIASYGTGLCIRQDSLFAADRLVNRNDQTFAIGRAVLSDLSFTHRIDLDTGVKALYGPRGLDYDTALHLFLLAFTDFQGTNSSDATFNGSYVYLLDPDDASTVKRYTINEGGSELVNIRGLAYDPRGAGNTAWITTLGSGGAKIVKVTLTDGPAAIEQHSAVRRNTAEHNMLDAIYPNPASTAVELQYISRHSGQIEFRVLITVGSEVLHQQFRTTGGEHQQKLDVTSLAAGSYLVELRLDGERIGSRNLTVLK
jgi:photosystem II stability/assembly factor-like uncharacterized protein